MPKQTFLNLPEEKRQAIIDIAIDEFAEHEYSEVSISRMVERAGIAKGSFYQYFTDKKDLLLFLLDLGGQKKLELLRAVQPPDPQMGMFPFVKHLIRSGLAFQAAFPKLNRVAFRAIYGEMPFRDESLQRLKDAAAAYYLQLIDMGIANGDVDPQVDRSMAAFVLGAVFNDLGNYFMKKIGLDPMVMVERRFTDDEVRALEDVLDGANELLRCGIGNKRSC